MERTKFKQPETIISYNNNDEPIVISKVTTDIILKQKKPAELIALYWFYYQTAKWQKTNQPRSTTEYTAKGLNWGTEKVQRYKKQLIELGLIENVVSRNKENRVTGHFIKVNFIWTIPKNHPSTFPGAGKSQPLENLGRNTLNTNNKILNTNNKILLCPNSIKTNQFETFFSLYPKKDGKGKAMDKWNTICSRKNKQAPTWEEIETAIKEQKKSQRWQNETFIPLAATWLNQSRWIDDPKEMVSYDRKEQTTKRTKSNNLRTYDEIITNN